VNDSLSLKKLRSVKQENKVSIGRGSILENFKNSSLNFKRSEVRRSSETHQNDFLVPVFPE
jgi:hypothetical protein